MRPFILPNPLRDAEHRPARAAHRILAFHRALPGYAPAPLLDLPAVARRLGVARVLAKAETQRCGLPSFKVLGASWAAYRALVRRCDLPAEWVDDPGGRGDPFAALAAELGSWHPTLVAATDGNHGRAVAFVARRLGLPARIMVPAGTSGERSAAIAEEGAEVEVVPGDYDAAVARAAGMADGDHVVIADTAVDLADPVPSWVIDGYATLLAEIATQLRVGTEPGTEPGAPGGGEAGVWPEVVAVPMGVGALAVAVVRFVRGGDLRAASGGAPLIVGVEPVSADGIRRSLAAGGPVTVPGPHRSIMAGLNCGAPSAHAWPDLAAGLDLAVAVDDSWAVEAMRVLAGSPGQPVGSPGLPVGSPGLAVGETGAAGLAGLLAVGEGSDDPAQRRTDRELGRLGPGSTVLILCTEAPTDLAAYRALVGRSPTEVAASAVVRRRV